MIDMTLKAAKGGFFDRTKVKNAVDAGTREVLSRFGAFVRQRAKTSIRNSDDISRPGKPPHSHTGLLRKLIYFAYDRQRRSVVIGPTLINEEGSYVPRILEYGGEVTRLVGAQVRRYRYRARPYMRPAFEAEITQLPLLWRNSVR
jgi:hypothetical protein